MVFFDEYGIVSGKERLKFFLILLFHIIEAEYLATCAAPCRQVTDDFLPGVKTEKFSVFFF